MRNALHITCLILVYYPLIRAGSQPDAAQDHSRQPGLMQIAEQYLERATMLYDRSDFDSLPFYYQSAWQIFDAFQAREKAVRCRLGMVDYYRLTGDADTAWQRMLETEAYILRHMSRETLSWADARYTRAKLEYRFHRVEEARTSLEDAIRLYERLDASLQKRSRCYDVLGSVYLIMGDLDRALESYHQAYRVLTDLDGEPRPELGNLLYNIGVAYIRKRDPDAGAEYTRRSIEINRALFGPDYPELANAYNSLSSCYIQKARPDSAKACLDEAERILLKGSGRFNFDRADLFVNRARVARLEGDHFLALEYYGQALRNLEAREMPRESLMRTVYLNMANIYQAMGRFKEASVCLDRLMRYGENIHPVRLARYEMAKAGNLLNSGKAAEAKGYLESAAEVRNRELPAEDPERIWEYLLFARMYDTLRQCRQALHYLDLALKISQNTFGDSDFQTSEIFRARAAHFLHNGEAEEALDMVQSAIRSLFPDAGISSLTWHPPPESSQHPFNYLEILDLKIQILDQLVDHRPDSMLHFWQSSLEAGKTAIRLIEFLRNSYASEQSMLYISEKQRGLYTRCIRAAWHCHDLSGAENYLASAFETAERAKYATLVSSIRRENALRVAGVPDSVRKTLDRLRTELTINREALITERNSDSLPDRSRMRYFENQIFRVSDQLARMYASLQEEHPGYFDLLYNHRVASPGEVQKDLRKGDLLLEYYLSPDHLYIFSLRKNSLRCKRFSLSELDLDRCLKILSEYLTVDLLHDTIRYSHSDFFAAAHELYRYLVPDREGDKHLIIIPEGSLAYLPFDALVTEPAGDFDGLYDRIPFLIKKFSIRHAYSATLMRMDERGTRRAKEPLIAFAPGYMDETNPAQGQDPSRVEVHSRQLTPLPHSIREVTEICGMLGGTAFTGTMASESRFKALARESHIIHLAAHTFLDDEEPLQSKIVFADPQADGEGYLNVYEIYDLDINAGMVVLSACNTGSGRIQGGEGIMSLARAFRFAGAPNILMSLWTVSDLNSYDLMSRFYRALSQGHTTERAIQKAKLTYLEEVAPPFRHPQYWAGFILAGNAERILIPLYIKILMTTALTLLLGGLLWSVSCLRKRTRAKSS